MRLGVVLGGIGMLLHLSSFAVVDPKNANYHFSVALKLGERTSIDLAYNSRTIYRGLFGFGWCTDLETRWEAKDEGTFELVHCGAGSKTTFELTGRPRQPLPDIAELVARRGKGKFYDNFGSGPVPLDSVAKVRQLLSQGISATELMQLVGEDVPQLGAGDYVSSDGSKATFDGALVRVVWAKQAGQAVFDRRGLLVERTMSMGQRINILERGPSRLVFKVDGVTAVLELDKIGRPTRLIDESGTMANFGYTQSSGYTTLAEVATGSSGRFKFEYDDLVNLIARRKDGQILERITYDQNNDWALSTHDLTTGCRETYSYHTKPDQEVENTLGFFAELRARSSPKALIPTYYSKVRKRCGEAKEALAGIVGFATALDTQGQQFMSAATSWFVNQGNSFAEYSPDKELRAVTQPPVSVRSTLDSRASTLANVLFTVRYNDPGDCAAPLVAEGVFAPPGLASGNAFSARAQRRRMGLDCVIEQVEWKTPAGTSRLSVERDAAGISQAWVLDGQHRARRRTPGDPMPSTCSLTGIEREQDEKRIAGIVIRALAASCPPESRLVYQMALVFSMIQSQYTCGCSVLSPMGGRTADFARGIVLDEYLLPGR